MDDRWLTKDELTQIAIADGFGAWSECFRFFSDLHGFPFQGVLIKWEVSRCKGLSHWRSSVWLSKLESGLVRAPEPSYQCPNSDRALMP